MKIKFQDQYHPDFHQVIKQRVENYFEETKTSKHANGVMIAKTILFLALQIGLYLAMMSDFFSAPVYILLFATFGAITGLMNFNIGHDALHKAYSSRPLVNKLLGYLYDLNGTSSFVWKISHNLWHHTYTNIPGYDNDIDKAILLRLNPKDKRYPFHYYQHIYAFFLYCLASANWVLYSDYVLFVDQIRKGKASPQDITLFFTFKIVNLFLLVIWPMFWLHYSPWVILFGYLCGQMAAGITISIIFQLAHVVQNVSYVEPDEKGIIPMNWAAHEVMTTSNFATHNLFWIHLLGGLNFQVEHHLFPTVCHVHYPKIQKIVRQTTEEFRLPYNEYPTFFNALRSHYLLLKELGRKDTTDHLHE
jgi:linoleoyl-CoA desaturase